ncbi:MAG: hypothetical protein JWN12_265 [Candidatus Saccharibacteria bacterium]|nr:hypothetical protein [Candidatus Saccharibacteria bacterium]
MSGSLTILFVIALVLAFLGVIAYSPLAMIVSVTVIGFSVLLTSMLFGLIFGVRVHTESSFITAVILFFIFTPTLEVSGLLGLVLVGMIAGASKFILAFKGRHIFNPAAIAAFIIGLTGIAHASWWVGTPLLIIPTFLLGFAVLQKTRRVPSSGTFIGLATVLVIIVLMVEGETLGGSLVLWLSWPVLFFSSFMLTEPLTLPGKKWQQILEAAVVAILFAIPINIGDFSTSPAFALVIGNLIAFGFTRRQKVTLTFVEQKQLTPTTYEFIFTPRTPLRYAAGQYLEIRVPHKHDDFRGSRRSFSITSAPGEETLRLGVKFYEPSSSFKKALRTLEKSAVIESTGISGDFTLPKDKLTPLLYVAGGIGITPFISHLQTLKRRNEARDSVLFYSINSIDELAYKDILESAGIKVFIITKTNQRLTLPKNWVHINEPFITKEVLATYISDVDTRTAYISGPPLMIDGVKKQLKQLHVTHIKTDYFIGY